MVILIWGRDWFELPYDNSDPLYADQDWLDKNPGMELIYDVNDPTNKCHVYTIVFQAFVMMQIFNMINARKLLNDQYNVFADFFNNFRFILVLIIIIVVQISLVYFGGRAFKTVPLDRVEQIVCVALGLFSLVWGVIIKLIMPPSLFDWLSIDEKELDDKEALDTVQGQFRRSYRHSRTMRDSKVRPDMSEDDDMKD